MNLQISLLVLGILAIVAIYFFSRLQEKKRRSNQSPDRATGAAVAPAFERNEPDFGNAVRSHDSNSRVASEASLDSFESPVMEDYVDADNMPDDPDFPAGGQQSGSSYHSSDPGGASASVEIDAEVSETVAEVDDIPTLENLVHAGESTSTFEPVTSAESEAELGDRFVDELDVLSDMVEPPPLADESEKSSEYTEQAVAAVVNEEPAAANPGADTLGGTDVVAENDPADIPVLMESEVVIPESFVPSAEIVPADTQSFEAVASGSEESKELFDDIAEEDTEADYAEEDYAESRPSLKAFLGSIGPINKLKENIQNQLDSVKAERERARSGADRKPDIKPEVVVETDFAINSDLDSQVAATADTSAPGHEFIIDSDEDPGAGAPAPDLSAAPLMSAEPIESVELAEGHHNQTVDEMTSDTTPSQSSTGAPRIEPAEGFDKLSQIDYYVKLSGERDVSRDSVLAIYREGAAGIARTHSIYGLRLPEKVWRDLEQESEDARFGDLVVTIQLVDESGLVTENDMTRFSSLIMKLSESTGRGFSFMAPIESAHRQAQAIDQFKQKFDSIFVVNIRPLESEMFEGAVIERCAKQIGLTTDENQFFARYKPVGKQKVCLYSLANMSDTGEFDLENMRAVRTRGVTFFTRPAINRSPGAVFAEMVDAAKAFASRIKGEVIAPGYEDLSMEDVEAIRRSIENVAAEMESYGINPGSEEATRLFG